jgi:hypothetical protein
MGKSEAYKTRYATLPHMAGRAYVVAIANYGRQDFNFLGDVAMQRLLYDPEDKQAVEYNPAGLPAHRDGSPPGRGRRFAVRAHQGGRRHAPTLCRGHASI